jgi:poly(A) polymerase
MDTTIMEKAKLLQAEIKKVFGDTPVELVGGSVRDIVLGKEPKDWDYCTPLDPDAIEAAVKAAGRRAYITGKKFGTIGFTLQIERESLKVEVTTYRTEKYVAGSRKPEVEFTKDLDLDLSRRDLTINAMVLKEDGSIYDPFGGRIDLLQKQIKTVGLPKDRIKEDPLRMLRAARFASQLGFTIDPNMIGKMRQEGRTIETVSRERWVQELDKLLDGEYVKSGIKVLIVSDIAKYVLPEVWLACQEEDVYTALIQTLTNNRGVGLDEKWALLHAYIGYPYTVAEKKGRVTFVNHEVVRRELLNGICLRLKFSNDRKNALLKDNTIFNKSIDL